MPVLHPAEHMLDNIAPATGDAVERIWVTSCSIGKDHDLSSERLEALMGMGSVIGFIYQQALRWRDIVEQNSDNADVGDGAGR